ncbi:MAG: glycosyltransferase [Acidobacteriia bacterium]|nr:glycosyltransferase [Terriglobia bacterium]
MYPLDNNTEEKVLSSVPFRDYSDRRTSRLQAFTVPEDESVVAPGACTASAWTFPETSGLSSEKVLLNELASLDWRVSRLEAAFLSMARLWTWGNRVYRRVGHALLRTPASAICQRLMGNTAADEKYRQWLIQHRATDRYRYSEPNQRLVQIGTPLISLIMPLYQPNLAWLESAVNSVRTQLYQKWQLLIVCDGDPLPDAASLLESLVSEDARIQCLCHARGGISSALNRGLNACSGTYTGFLDQDDILEPTALSHVAAAIIDDEPDLIYTDEDYVSECGVPQLPLFKPAWSPALLLSCMYVGHLLVVATKRALGVGGFRSAYDGAQDHDFVLRLTDDSPRAVVTHIPRVLYHWRQHMGSTALAPDSKPYSQEAGLGAVQDALERRQYRAVVHPGRIRNTYGFTRVPSSNDSAAIIVPTRNPKLLGNLLESLRAVRSGFSREVHVVLHCQGNQSDEKIATLAGRYGARLFEYRGPFNFALMNNLAVNRVASSFLVFLNDDVLVRSDEWLEHLCAPFIRPEVGIAGALLHYPDGMIEHSGVVTGISDGVGHAGRFQLESSFWPWLQLTRNVSAVTGACFAIRRTLFEQLGGFDIRYHNNYNDVDLCLRAQNAGFEVVVSTSADLCHAGGQTRARGTGLQERLSFWARWGNVLSQVDYFYSPNLSRRLETIDLSVPSWQ